MTTTLTPEQLNDGRPPFVVLLGIHYTSVSQDSLEAEMLVRDDMCTPHETCHGGAMMTFADTMGAVSTVVNMPRDARTVTMESKTNFLCGAPVGESSMAKPIVYTKAAAPRCGGQRLRAKTANWPPVLHRRRW